MNNSSRRVWIYPSDVSKSVPHKIVFSILILAVSPFLVWMSILHLIARVFELTSQAFEGMYDLSLNLFGKYIAPYTTEPVVAFLLWVTCPKEVRPQTIFPPQKPK